MFLRRKTYAERLEQTLVRMLERDYGESIPSFRVNSIETRLDFTSADLVFDMHIQGRQTRKEREAAPKRELRSPLTALSS